MHSLGNSILLILFFLRCIFLGRRHGAAAIGESRVLRESEDSTIKKAAEVMYRARERLLEEMVPLESKDVGRREGSRTKRMGFPTDYSGTCSHMQPMMCLLLLFSWQTVTCRLFPRCLFSRPLCIYVSAAASTVSTPMVV